MLVEFQKLVNACSFGMDLPKSHDRSLNTWQMCTYILIVYRIWGLGQYPKNPYEYLLPIWQVL